MSEHLHPALHPDPDSLSALVEGVLPEHERLACLAHLAECSRCREIVYLAQDPPAEPTPAPIAIEPVGLWKRWFAPIPALSAAAVACVLVLSIAVYRQYDRPTAPAPQLTAGNTPAVIPPAPELPGQPPSQDSATAKTTPHVKARVDRESMPTAVPQTPPPVPANDTPAGTLAGISGRVTDPAGAVIPEARINLFDSATGKVFTSTSDARGQFDVAGLEPGRYRLSIVSPGFKQASKQIDLQPQEIAKADSILEIGAATDTVTVNAEAPLLKTESGELSHVVTAPANTLPILSANGNRAQLGLVDPLPDKSPPVSTAAKDKLMLAADSAGALFLSNNAGKTWKPVKGAWQGKVVHLSTIPDPAKVSNLLFQLTTDSASVWLSRDGNHWYRAPAHR